MRGRRKGNLAPLRLLLGQYEAAQNWSPKSARRIDLALFPFIESLGQRPPGEIWLSDVRDYIRSLEAKGQAPATQKLALGKVYGFLNWLAQQSELGKLDYHIEYLSSYPSREVLLSRELNWELLDE